MISEDLKVRISLTNKKYHSIKINKSHLSQPRCRLQIHYGLSFIIIIIIKINEQNSTKLISKSSRTRSK